MTSPRPIDDLLRDSGWGELDGEAFLAGFAALVAERIGASAAGVRLLVDDGSRMVLRTVVLYERPAGQLADVADVAGPGIEGYLETMARRGGLAASRVDGDERLPSPLRARLAERGVHALLDAALSINGLVYGSVSCECRRPVAWAPRQVDALRRLTVRAGVEIVRQVDELLRLGGDAQRLAPVGPLD